MQHSGFSARRERIGFISVAARGFTVEAVLNQRLRILHLVLIVTLRGSSIGKSRRTGEDGL